VTGRPRVKPADLHLHSSASDGLFTAREVMRRAHGLGMKAVALTDHDTLTGLAEAAAEAGRLGLGFVPGCEVSVAWEGRDLHVLAYHVPAGESPLCALLAQSARMRRERVQAMIARLRQLGVEIAEAAVWSEAAASQAVGRAHVARALARSGAVGSLDEAFRRFIGNAGPAFVPKVTPSLERVLEAIWVSGAVPVLAHPGGYDLESIRERIAALDIGGIEVAHPRHTPDAEARLIEWAGERGWIATGGSDWHGDERPDLGIGCRGVGLEILAALRDRRR
jgi:3',5'-nucleoside bisphosphate phosphatase